MLKTFSVIYRNKHFNPSILSDFNFFFPAGMTEYICGKGHLLLVYRRRNDRAGRAEEVEQTGKRAKEPGISKLGKKTMATTTFLRKVENKQSAGGKAVVCPGGSGLLA